MKVECTKGHHSKKGEYIPKGKVVTEKSREKRTEMLGSGKFKRHIEIPTPAKAEKTATSKS